MKPRRRRQRADEEHDPGIVDFLSEADGGTPTVPSRPWRPAVVDEFASEEPLPPAATVAADIVPIRVAAARPAPPPNAMLRVITFGVYAMLAIGGAAAGWFVGGRDSALGARRQHRRSRDERVARVAAIRRFAPACAR